MEEILNIVLVPAAIVTAFVQLMKATVSFENIKQWIPWVAVLVLGPLAVWLCGTGDGTIKNIILNGLVAGFASIGMFELGKNVPVIDKVVK